MYIMYDVVKYFSQIFSADFVEKKEKNLYIIKRREKVLWGLNGC